MGFQPSTVLFDGTASCTTWKKQQRLVVFIDQRFCRQKCLKIPLINGPKEWVSQWFFTLKEMEKVGPVPKNTGFVGPHFLWCQKNHPRVESFPRLAIVLGVTQHLGFLGGNQFEGNDGTQNTANSWHVPDGVGLYRPFSVIVNS